MCGTWTPSESSGTGRRPATGQMRRTDSEKTRKGRAKEAPDWRFFAADLEGPRRAAVACGEAPAAPAGRTGPVSAGRRRLGPGLRPVQVARTASQPANDLDDRYGRTAAGPGECSRMTERAPGDDSDSAAWHPPACAEVGRWSGLDRRSGPTWNETRTRCRAGYPGPEARLMCSAVSVALRPQAPARPAHRTVIPYFLSKPFCSRRRLGGATRFRVFGACRSRAQAALAVAELPCFRASHRLRPETEAGGSRVAGEGQGLARPWASCRAMTGPEAAAAAVLRPSRRWSGSCLCAATGRGARRLRRRRRSPGPERGGGVLQGAARLSNSSVASRPQQLGILAGYAPVATPN